MFGRLTPKHLILLMKSIGLNGVVSGDKGIIAKSMYVGLLSFLSSIPAMMVLALFFPELTPETPDYSVFEIVFILAFFFPLLEIMLVVFVIGNARFFIKSNVYLALISAALLSALYWYSEPSAGPIVFLPFFIYSLVVARLWDKDFKTGFIVSYLAHVFHNVLSLLIFVLSLKLEAQGYQ